MTQFDFLSLYLKRPFLMCLVVCVVTQLNSTNYVYTIYSQCTISFVQLYHFNRTIFVWYLLNRSSVTYTCSQHLAEWHRTEEWARRQCWENEWEIYAAAERCWHQFTNVKTKREREKKAATAATAVAMKKIKKYKNVLFVWTRARNVCALITQRTEMKLPDKFNLSLGFLFSLPSSHDFYIWSFVLSLSLCLFWMFAMAKV